MTDLADGLALSLLRQLDLIREELAIEEVRHALGRLADGAQLQTLREITP